MLFAESWPQSAGALPDRFDLREQDNGADVVELHPQEPCRGLCQEPRAEEHECSEHDRPVERARDEEALGVAGDVGDVHDHHGGAEQEPGERPEGEEDGGDAHEAAVGAPLADREDVHRGDDDYAVDEHVERVGARGGLITDVKHERVSRGAAVDEEERDDHGYEGDDQGGSSRGDPCEAWPVLSGFHDAAAEEREPDHEEAVAEDRREVAAAEEPVDREVDGVDVEGHRQGDGEGSVGDAAVCASSAQDEQPQEECPHHCCDEQLGHPKISV